MGSKLFSASEMGRVSERFESHRSVTLIIYLRPKLMAQSYKSENRLATSLQQNELLPVGYI